MIVNLYMPSKSDMHCRKICAPGRKNVSQTILPTTPIRLKISSGHALPSVTILGFYVSSYLKFFLRKPCENQVCFADELQRPLKLKIVEKYVWVWYAHHKYMSKSGFTWTVLSNYSVIYFLCPVTTVNTIINKTFLTRKNSRDLYFKAFFYIRKLFR